MRPLLPASITVFWRDRHSIQVGLDPARARVVTGVDERFVDWLRSLDGTRSRDDAVAAASSAGLTAESAVSLLLELGRSGAVVDGTGRGAPTAGLDAEGRDRMLPLVESLALAGRDPGAALDRRRGSAVLLRGPGRLTVPIATLLGAAGVGRVHVVSHGVVTARDIAAGGFGAGDLGRPRAVAAADAVHRAAPQADTRRPSAARPPELVLLAGTAALDPELAAPLQQRGIAHLPCWIRENTALLGPLVRPGQTGCLRCVDLHRTDRDPAWPSVCSQLVGRSELPGGDPSLVATLAGAAALAAVRQLDGDDPVVLHASMEMSASDGLPRRRHWPPHPRCGCTERTEADSRWPVAG